MAVLIHHHHGIYRSAHPFFAVSTRSVRPPEGSEIENFGKQEINATPVITPAHFSFRRSIRCPTDVSFSNLGAFVPKE